MPRAKNKLWAVHAENTDGQKIGHLYLYGLIRSKAIKDDGVTPQKFQSDLDSLGEVDTIIIHIFSDGGDYFAGNAIFAIIKQHTAKKIAYVEGLTASIATMAMFACDEVYISRNGHILIHLPMAGIEGFLNRLELADIITEITQYEETMIATHMSATGNSREDVIAIMTGKNYEGTWYKAQDAIDAGLAIGFIPEESEAALPAVACLGPDKYDWNGIQFDLSAYPNAPKITNRRTKEMPKTSKPTVAKKMGARSIQAEATSVTCPECGHVFEYDPPATEEGDEVSTEAISVTCPECGHVFEPDAAADPEKNEEETPAPEAKAKSKTTVKATRRVVAELLSVYCPECYQEFTVETGEAPADAGGGVEAARKPKVVAQIYSVTCPECGHVFNCENNPATPAYPVETVEPQAKAEPGYHAGVKAERERLVALDSIAEADPESADIVAEGKRLGWTYQATSRRVFDAMASRNHTGGAYMHNRSGEILNSGTGKIGAAHNAGANGAPAPNTQVSAVNKIAAGFAANKTGRK